jgi:hypothetical protein
MAGSGCAAGFSNPHPADLIHLQKLHILRLEAGVVGAHVLFCKSLDNPFEKRTHLKFPKKREKVPKKREKYTIL